MLVLGCEPDLNLMEETYLSPALLCNVSWACRSLTAARSLKPEDQPFEPATETRALCCLRHNPRPNPGVLGIDAMPRAFRMQ